MISDRTKAYYDLKKRNDVRESAKRLRRQFLRYKDAEIVYSITHKKLLELAGKAGAIYPDEHFPEQTVCYFGLPRRGRVLPRFDSDECV